MQYRNQSLALDGKISPKGLCVSMAMQTFISTLHLKKMKQEKRDEKLTFVASGNRSQAKEEEGEKIHSVHLKKEKGEDKRTGMRRGDREEEGVGGVQFMHQQRTSRGDSTVTRSRSGNSDGTEEKISQGCLSNKSPLQCHG